MAFRAPEHIIPKFLWKHIIKYMSYDDVIKMATTAKRFAGLVDEDTGRSNLIEHRTNAIAVVKCNVNQMDYFWKYALQTYIGCDNINDLLQYIEDDINHIADYIYYKVFIKIGDYILDNSEPKYYSLNQCKCSIEINGSKEGPTWIRYTYHKYGSLRPIYAVIPNYFSMRHVNFDNVSCIFTKYNPDFYYRYIDDDVFIRVNHYSELYIYRCTFAKCHESNINARCIDKITIVNCTFDTGLSIYNITEKKFRLKLDHLGLSGNTICDISHSTFSINDIYDCISIMTKLPFTLLFTNNTILKATRLFSGWYNDQTIIKASYNKICNLDVCAEKYCNVNFTNNHFDNVKLLHDETCENVIVDDTNVFIDCDKQLMDQIKIENIKQ